MHIKKPLHHPYILLYYWHVSLQQISKDSVMYFCAHLPLQAYSLFFQLFSSTHCTMSKSELLKKVLGNKWLHLKLSNKIAATPGFIQAVVTLATCNVINTYVIQ